MTDYCFIVEVLEGLIGQFRECRSARDCAVRDAKLWISQRYSVLQLENDWSVASRQARAEWLEDYCKGVNSAET